MSYLKMCIAAIAVAALFVTAVPASATVLCKTETLPACGSRYGAGTEISAHLVTETVSKTEEVPPTETKYIVICEESTFKFQTTNEGGATQTVTANTEAFTFGKCGTYKPPAVLNKPSLELHWLSGTPESPNARITAKGIEITVLYLLEDCVYGVPGGGSTGIAELRGGKPAVIALDMELAKLSGGLICPKNMRWRGNYEVTAPNPLYVAAS